MSVYQWKGAGYGLPSSAIGPIATYKKTIDVPYLISKAEKSGLALVAAPNVGVALASTGFAADDILEIFWVPKGTIIDGCGIYVITGEGATCTINAGTTSSTETVGGTDIDGWGVFNIETAGVVDGTADGDGWGTDNLPAGALFKTNGSIDIEFNHATDAAIFEFWARGMWIGDLVAIPT